MPDNFAQYELAPDFPAERSRAVVPSDAAELADIPRALLIGTGGTIVGRLKDDAEDVTFKVAAGYHPLRFKLIKVTGTTASDIVALF